MTNNFKEIEATCIARKEGPTHDEYKSMPPGFWTAYHEWRRTHIWNVDETTVVLQDGNWPNERDDFMKAMRDNGITTLVIIYSGSMLLDTLADYIKNGAEMVGMTKVQKKNPAPLFDDPQNGIKLTIKPKTDND